MTVLSEKAVLKRIIVELRANPLWKIIVLRNNWLCPYCGRVGARDLAMTEAIEQKIAWHFLKECERWEAFEGEPYTQEQLKRRAKLIVFKNRYARSLTEDARFRFSDAEGRWICPYCAEPTNVAFEPGSLDIGEGAPEDDPFVNRVCRHVLECEAYANADEPRPRSERTLEAKRGQIDRARRVKRVLKRFEAEAEFRYSDAEKRWLCPFCALATDIRLDAEALAAADAPPGSFRAADPLRSDTTDLSRLGPADALPFPPVSDDDLDFGGMGQSDDGSKEGAAALAAIARGEPPRRTGQKPGAGTLPIRPSEGSREVRWLTPAAEQFFLAMATHLEGCKAYTILEGRPRPQQVLRQKVTALNRERKLQRVRRKLARHPIWQIRDVASTWFCPYCAHATGLAWPASARGPKKTTDLATPDQDDDESSRFVQGVLDHLAGCEEYNRPKARLKTEKRMKRRVAEADERIEARRRVARWLTEDAVFSVCDEFGSWLCPFCRKIQKHVHLGLSQGSGVFDKTVEQVRRHLREDCAGYVAANGRPPDARLEELQQLANAATASPRTVRVDRPSREIEANEDWLKIQRELAEIRSEVEAQAERDRSLEEARNKQLRLLPRIPEIPGFEFGCVYRPCDRVGGDLYDFLQVSEHEWGIAIGDIAGHGIEAALLMGLVKKLLQVHARQRSSAFETLLLTNADLYPDLDAQTFVTAFYGLIDTRTKVLRFARAGHNALVLYNESRNPRLQELDSKGMALGMDPGPVFQRTIEECAVQLQRGDLLVQYTDGVNEAMNAQNEEFGVERLFATIERYGRFEAEYVLYKIEQAIERFCGGEPQKDDVTMIAARVLE